MEELGKVRNARWDVEIKTHFPVELVTSDVKVLNTGGLEIPWRRTAVILVTFVSEERKNERITADSEVLGFLLKKNEAVCEQPYTISFPVVIAAINVWVKLLVFPIKMKSGEARFADVV